VKKALLNFLKFVVFFSVGLGILYYLYIDYSQKYLVSCLARGMLESECDFGDKLIRDLKSVKPFWILMVFMTFTISNISRAIRWRMLLKTLGRDARLINTFLCTMIGYFTNLFLPRAGEVIKASTLSKYENIPIVKVMGTVVLDRLLDVISIFIVTFLALFLEFDIIHGYFAEPVKKFIGQKGPTILQYIVGFCVTSIILVYIFRSTFSKTKLYNKVISTYSGFKEGIMSIKNLNNLPIFIFHSVIIWFMYFTMVYLSFFAFEPTSHLQPIVALMVFVFGAWGIVIPSPGGMGSYHFLTILVLGIYGISEFDAASFSNISFSTINIGIIITFGIIGLLIIGYLNRKYTPLDLD